MFLNRNQQHSSIKVINILISVLFSMTSMAPYHVTDIVDDIDDSYWLWYELTMQIVNSHASIKSKTIKGKRVPYMNGELRKAINVRNM